MKVYLGDAVYVDFDGFGLILTTEDGVSVTNRIILEPKIYDALEAYVDTTYGKQKKKKKKTSDT